MKKRKILLSGSLLFCVAAAFSSFAAGEKDSGLAGIVEKSIIKNFEDQEKEAARSRELAKAGKYDEAIKVLKENVIDDLQNKASRADAWRVRERLSEYSQELRNLQLTYGNIKLRQAEEALLKGNFDETVALANDAIAITGLLRDKAMPLIVAAQGRKSAVLRKDNTSVAITDPTLEERELAVKKLLAEARSYFKAGRYDEAWKKVEEVYVYNPFNTDASYLASQIYKKFYQAGYQRRRADVQSLFAYEAWQWVEPTFPLHREVKSELDEKAIVKDGSDYAIQQKMDTIIFPVVSFNQIELEAVVQFMRNNKVFDPDKEGVMITFIQPSNKNTDAPAEGENAPADTAAPAGEENADAGEGEDGGEDGGEEDWGEDTASTGEKAGEKKNNTDGIFVTLELKNVSLRQLLDYVCFLTDLTYVIRNDRILFGSPDQRLITKEYEIFNSVKAMIAGKKGEEGGDMGGDMGGEDMGGGENMDFGGEEEGGDEGGGSEDGAVPEPAAAAAPVVNDADLTPEALQNFFSLYGIEFPEGSSISFFRGKVAMNNTAENHLLMESLLKDLNVEAPMIEVEVKSIELAEDDMEELGFNWAIGSMNNGNVSIYKGANTSSAGEGAMLKMLDNVLSGVDSRLISNLNIFPDIFGSFKPFGLDQTLNITLTINALDRSERTEQISAPRVLVANGVTATVKMTKAYYFPEDWEELEIETEEVGETDDLRIDITPPSPEFSETEEEIGTIFTVTPEIQEGGKTIRLKLNPKITAYTGKDSADVVLVTERLRDGKWEKNEQRFVVWRPVIATRELNVTVDVNHGETLVIGGLSDSTSQKRLYKIPILADIPFIGRLFQSQSEISTRRSMLIFVTARLVNNNGVPLPMTDDVGNGGIPRMVR